MKRMILLSLIVPFILSLITVFNAMAQTIRIANNNPGATPGTNVYLGATALQLAINASVTGDIIHVIPGSVSYGNATITDKVLTIIGIGLNPQKSIGSRSTAGELTINGASSSGTRLSGLHFTRLVLAVSITPAHALSNILVENCQLDIVFAPGNTNNSVANLIVRNCVLNGSNNTSEPQVFESYTTSGVIFTNNIIKGYCCSANSIMGTGLTIQNNIFYFNGTGGVFQGLHNSVVQNNIFFRVTGSAGSTTLNTGNAFYNNLVFGATDNTFASGTNGNTASGNITAQDPLLTNLPNTGLDWIYSWDITLLPGSPAINAGLDGTNIGPTGGSNPFDPEGTLLPLIEAITIPAVVTKGTNLEVNVKARGN